MGMGRVSPVAAVKGHHRSRPSQRLRSWLSDSVLAVLSILMAVGHGDAGAQLRRPSVTHPSSYRSPLETVQAPPRLIVREVLCFNTFESERETVDLGAVRGVALDDDGNLYVLDAQAPAVYVFAPAGGYLRTIGRSGQGPGEFRDPNGLLVTPDHLLWVADPAGFRYTRFRFDGSVVDTYHRHFSAGWGRYWDAVRGEDGRIYESTTIRNSEGTVVLSSWAYSRKTDSWYPWTRSHDSCH
jgi:hypothetical protein